MDCAKCNKPLISQTRMFRTDHGVIHAECLPACPKCGQTHATVECPPRPEWDAARLDGSFSEAAIEAAYPNTILRKPLAQRILRLDDNDRVSSCGKNSEFICAAWELKALIR
jgi:hypothetical protein